MPYRPYHLELDLGALHVLQTQNLFVELGEAPEVGGFSGDVAET